MIPSNILPLLLFLFSALPIALALAGLFIDERAAMPSAGAGANDPARRPAASGAGKPRLSPGRASVTVAAGRQRAAKATGTRYFPQAAQRNLAIAT